DPLAECCLHRLGQRLDVPVLVGVVLRHRQHAPKGLWCRLPSGRLLAVDDAAVRVRRGDDAVAHRDGNGFGLLRALGFHDYLPFLSSAMRASSRSSRASVETFTAISSTGGAGVRSTWTARNIWRCASARTSASECRRKASARSSGVPTTFATSMTTRSYFTRSWA